ncbi:adenine phosphoribosyltransferase [Xylocopilactobacillus apis]|uniref:Adenine phosphoribosyltransferase n=1 Tax=Xylocopilactobacillus apis TaxID=2932183 RepID=A0AAU9D9C1_9LACO|nr:adenine phosphoribosyltransferase [Xylocopilactobacillus apis]BDR56265.1 adenine phosphoribosyltransferase [Xylocopilactobacillus apis]
MDYSKFITSTPDFPIKGILFRDVSPLLADGQAFKSAIKEIAVFAKSVNADLIVGPEARGFIIGAALANEMGIGFQPARREGKLPGEVVKESYSLEYGENILEMEKNSVKKGQKVLLVDDLLATGGTIEDTRNLVKRLGGEVVGASFIVELSDLKGRDQIRDLKIQSLVTY